MDANDWLFSRDEDERGVMATVNVQVRWWCDGWWSAKIQSVKRLLQKETSWIQAKQGVCERRFHHSPRLGKHKRSIVPKLDNCIAVWKMAPVICKALEVSWRHKEPIRSSLETSLTSRNILRSKHWEVTRTWKKAKDIVIDNDSIDAAWKSWCISKGCEGLSGGATRSLQLRIRFLNLDHRFTLEYWFLRTNST